MTSTGLDPAQTREWLDAMGDVVREEGPERAWELLAAVGSHARDLRVPLPTTINTPYLNTIPADLEPELPGDPQIEHRIASWLRWNAVAMVLQANAEDSGLGGHISSYASAATLYEVGFNHFWRAPTDSDRGDLVYIQGHSSPGIYARAFLEGRLTEDQLRGFRREVDGGGLSSYPHPWLMPDFWQFPTRLDGPRSDHGDQPGALHALPPRPRDSRHGRAQGLGFHGRRRDGRTRVDRLDRTRWPRWTRQPDLRHQLQPAAA